MRELTFKGYLLAQLQKFSETNSTSLYTFSHIANNNARLRDALCLYLVLFTASPLRCKLLKKYKYLVEPFENLAELTMENIDSFLCTEKFNQYKTVYDNYLYMRDKKSQEDKIKLMMHSRISELKRIKNVTNYRIYTVLNLNPGNANAFLKNGDVSKVSLDTTRRILKFVNEY